MTRRYTYSELVAVASEWPTVTEPCSQKKVSIYQVSKRVAHSFVSQECPSLVFHIRSTAAAAAAAAVADFLFSLCCDLKEEKRFHKSVLICNEWTTTTFCVRIRKIKWPWRSTAAAPVVRIFRLRFRWGGEYKRRFLLLLLPLLLQRSSSLVSASIVIAPAYCVCGLAITSSS